MSLSGDLERLGSSDADRRQGRYGVDFITAEVTAVDTTNLQLDAKVGGEDVVTTDIPYAAHLTPSVGEDVVLALQASGDYFAFASIYIAERTKPAAEPGEWPISRWETLVEFAGQSPGFETAGTGFSGSDTGYRALLMASDFYARTRVRRSAHFSIAKCRDFEFHLMTNSLTAQTLKFYLTDDNATAVGTPTSDTADHLGIRGAAGVYYFSTANGTTEQTTDITAFLTANKDHTYRVTFDGTTAKLYIDGTLRATHATSVPSASTTDVLNVRIENVGTSKTIYVTFARLRFAY